MLRKKMLRDLLKNFLAYAACASIIAIGLMTYVSMKSVLDTLNRAKDDFYTEYRFADGFAYFDSMPLSALQKLRTMEGIDRITGRLVMDVRVLFPERNDNVTLRLVSVDTEETNPLNDIWITEGTGVSAGQRAVITGMKFFDANHLQVGQDIIAVVNGRKVDLKVLGKGQSPDYVYAVKTATDFLSSAESFGIAFISYDVMESLFDTNGTINQIAFTLKKGYSFEDIRGDLENRLERYGMTGIEKQKDQVSNFMLTQEIRGLEETASSIPVLFLSISTLILWIMLKRLVERQRTQIGMLKANGYSSFRIVRHYISYSVVIGLIGGILGGLGGYLISDYMLVMYNEFFTLPNLASRFSIGYFLTGIFLSILFCSMAGLLGARAVFKLEPAESMHPPAPVSGKKIVLENLALFWRMLTVQGKMAARNIFRSKGRSLFTAIGIAFAFSLMASLFSFIHMMDLLIFDNFKYVQKYDAKISVSVPKRQEDMVNELYGFQHMGIVEPMLEIPATLIKNHIRKGTVILGIQKDSILYHLVDKNKTRIPLSVNGMILSEQLAEKLGVSPGDLMEIETPFSTADKIEVRVADTVPQYIGGNGYMTMETLNRLMGWNDLCNAVLIKAPAQTITMMEEELTLSETVSGIEESKQTQQKFIDMMDQFFYMIYVMAAMAVLTGFAIVYNSGIISLSERERELASLRVIGMSNREVLQVVSFEQNFLALIGMLAGIPLTILFNRVMAQSFNTDLYSIPEVILPVDFIAAFVGTVLSLLLSFIFIKKRILKLDMVEVLKERE